MVQGVDCHSSCWLVIYILYIHHEARYQAKEVTKDAISSMGIAQVSFSGLSNGG